MFLSRVVAFNEHLPGIFQQINCSVLALMIMMIIIVCASSTGFMRLWGVGKCLRLCVFMNATAVIDCDSVNLINFECNCVCLDFWNKKQSFLCVQ